MWTIIKIQSDLKTVLILEVDSYITVHKMASPDPDWRYEKSLKECNTHMLNSDKYFDFTFRIVNKTKGTEVKMRAFRVMLVARSPVFEKIFVDEPKKKEMVVNDVTPEVFYELLRFMYTDEVTLTEENVMEVLGVSQRYQVSALTSQCESYVEQRANASNAAALMEQSIVLGSTRLQEHCLLIMQLQSKQVLASEAFLDSCKDVVRRVLESESLSEPEISLFHACMTWAERKLLKQQQREQLQNTGETPGNLRSVLGDLLYLIRFPTMTLQQFSNHVVPRNLLDDEETLKLFKHFHCPTTAGQLPFSEQPRVNPMQFNPMTRQRCRKCKRNTEYRVAQNKFFCKMCGFLR